MLFLPLRTLTRSVFVTNGVNLSVPIFEHGFDGLFNVVL
jgi:hypothetical protein